MVLVMEFRGPGGERLTTLTFEFRGNWACLWEIGGCDFPVHIA